MGWTDASVLELMYLTLVTESSGLASVLGGLSGPFIIEAVFKCLWAMQLVKEFLSSQSV